MMPTAEQERMLHKTLYAVTQDTEQLQFNTAIARMMEFTNFFTKEARRPRLVMDQFVLLLSPFAPHIAEELWQTQGHTTTLVYEQCPAYDEKVLQEKTIEIPVQINGKLR
jgi:leucyl-tRNA synthetase